MARRPPARALHAIVAGLGILVVVAVSGCMPAASTRTGGTLGFASPASAFDIRGRLSARHAGEALAANFRWHHDASTDRLELMTPVGQTIAILQGSSAGGVVLDRGNGEIDTAHDWQTLTERGLGWSLPVDGLSSWVQGAPRAGEPFAVEPGGTVLRQAGWTIVYEGERETASGAKRPSRIVLSYPDIEVRIVVDAWDA